MPYINVNNTKLFYEEFGTGDKVLISTQRFFFTGCHMELLAKPPYDYHVYLITMRGCGKSDHIDENFQRDWTKIWGEDVKAFAKSLGINQFYYSGISHGCWAGWYIALHYPHLLKGFCVTSGVAQYANSSVPDMDYKQAKQLVGNKELLKEKAWNCHLKTNNKARLVKRAACVQEHYNLLLSYTADEFMIRNTNTAACEASSETELYKKLSKINIPILIINGAHDNLSTPEKALKAALVIPNSQFLLYENMDHGGPDECPQEIARACNRFFNDIENKLL